MRHWSIAAATLVVLGVGCSARNESPLPLAPLGLVQSSSVVPHKKAHDIMTVHSVGESLHGDIIQDIDGSLLFSPASFSGFQRLSGTQLTTYPVIAGPVALSATYWGALAVDNRGNIYDSVQLFYQYYSFDEDFFQGANIFPGGATTGTFSQGINASETVAGTTDRNGNYWALDNDIEPGLFGYAGAYIFPVDDSVGIPTFYTYPGQDRVDLITRGPGDDMWVTGQTFTYQSESLYLVSIGGVVKTYTIPNGASAAGLAEDATGNLWYTDPKNNAIGELRLASGTFREFAIPTKNAGPSGIALGADGAIWFTESTANKIGRITLGDHINEFDIPVKGTPAGITGPNFDSRESKHQLVWFVEKSGSPNDDAVVSIKTRG